MTDTKTEVLAQVVHRRCAIDVQRILVVGCGSGIEAAVLQRVFACSVVGIDLKDDFSPEATRTVDLRLGDAENLCFESETFDFVYSYHALEHIPRPESALCEMQRVLRPSGIYCIGTPNRLRVVGYVGSKDATWTEKLNWNVIDWSARLRGRFRNDMGAHAGFSKGELAAMLATHFGTVFDITLEYYSNLYTRYHAVLAVLEFAHLSRVVFPSIYFFGHKLVPGAVSNQCMSNS
jgi:SAM-dependent methyltransferase